MNAIANTTNTTNTTIIIGNSHGFGAAVTCDVASNTFIVHSWDDENEWGNWSLRFDSIEAVDECLAANLWSPLSDHPDYQNLVALDQAVAEWAEEVVSDLLQAPRGMTNTITLGNNYKGIAFAAVCHPGGGFTIHSWNDELLCGHWAAGFTHLWEVNEYLAQNEMPPLSGI